MIRLFSNDANEQQPPRRLFTATGSNRTGSTNQVANEADATADNADTAAVAAVAASGTADAANAAATADAAATAVAVAPSNATSDDATSTRNQKASTSTTSTTRATTASRPADAKLGDTAVAASIRTPTAGARPSPHTNNSDRLDTASSSSSSSSSNGSIGSSASTSSVDENLTQQLAGARKARSLNPLLGLAIVAFLVFSSSASLIVGGWRFENGNMIAGQAVTASQLPLVIGFLSFQLISSTLLTYFVVRPTNTVKTSTTFLSLLAQLLWFISVIVTLPGLVNHLLSYRAATSNWLMYAGLLLLVLAVASIVISANTISSDTLKLVINLCYLTAFMFASVCLFYVGSLVEHNGHAIGLTFADVSYLVSFDVNLPWLSIMIFKQLPTSDLILAGITTVAGLFLGLQVTRRRQDSDPFFDGAFALAITCLMVAICHCLMVLTSNVIVCLVLAITGICFALYGLARKRIAVCIFGAATAGLAITLFIQVANNLTALQQFLP
jgi:hypothetical protein